MARIEALRVEISRLTTALGKSQKEVATMADQLEKSEREVRSLRAQLNRLKSREE